MKAKDLITVLQKAVEKNGEDIEVASIDMEGEACPAEIFVYEDKETGDIGLASDCWNDAAGWAGHEGDEWDMDEWCEFRDSRDIRPFIAEEA